MGFQEDIELLADILDIQGIVRFEYAKVHYEIFESTIAEGYLVNLYTKDTVDIDNYYLDENSKATGFCDGEPLEAITYMLKEIKDD